MSTELRIFLIVLVIIATVALTFLLDERNDRRD
jgi:hypothetical protein